MSRVSRRIILQHTVTAFGIISPVNSRNEKNLESVTTRHCHGTNALSFTSRYQRLVKMHLFLWAVGALGCNRQAKKLPVRSGYILRAPSGYKSMISFSFHPLKRMEEEIICNRWKCLIHTYEEDNGLTIRPWAPFLLLTGVLRHCQASCFLSQFSTANNRVTNR